MTCEVCHLPGTFNMNCRQCVIKHLRMVPKHHAKEYLRNYRTKHGEDAMLKLIAEVKSDF